MRTRSVAERLAESPKHATVGGNVRLAVLIRLAGALLFLGLLVSACASDPAAEAVAEARPAPVNDRLEFTDVAQEVGLDFRHGAFRWEPAPDPAAMMSGGVCWLDYDNDGWLDLFAVNSFAEVEFSRWQDEGGTPTTALYRNDEGVFEDVSSAAGADLEVRGNGCVAADFDLDGHTDLYITTAREDMLLWNGGDGTFLEGARDAGIASFGWHTGAAVGDVNADGWPDLFVAGYANVNAPNPDATEGFPNTRLGVRDLLFLNNGQAENGEVMFREVGIEAGLEATEFEYGLGALFSDFDRDGDLDLYLANDITPNRLFKNVPWPGGVDADPAGLGFRFEELAAKAGVADPNAGMGVAGGDYDGDGRSDLFVTNLRGQVHGVFRSQVSDLVDPSFTDERLVFGPDLGKFTGWGVSWADLDLDTDLDLVIVNGHVPLTDFTEDAQPAQALENLSAQGDVGLFVDASDETGIAELGPLHARGSAAADFDNDGDLDIAINSIGSPLILLRNDGASGNWLELEFDGFVPGTSATAVLSDGTELIREVHAGSSYLSSEDPRLHFGLGTAESVDELVITWPGGDETRLTDVEANQLVSLEPPE